MTPNYPSTVLNFGMKLNPIYRNTLILALWISFAFSQFSEVSVTIDTRMLRGNTEEYLVQSLKEQVQSYYLTSLFSPEALDLGLIMDIQLVVESITITGNKKLISGQALFSNSDDQQYFARGFEFKYDAGESMVFSQMFQPLTSFFDYYAFLFIAAELDTYDEFGGNLYYSKILDISDSGKSSTYSRGWDVRQKRAKEIRENLELRRAKFYFFQAYDTASIQKVTISELREPLINFYTNLEISIGTNGNDRYTEPFLKAHANDIAIMLKAVKMIDELNSMMELDPENVDVYKSVLKDKD